MHWEKMIDISLYAFSRTCFGCIEGDLSGRSVVLANEATSTDFDKIQFPAFFFFLISRKVESESGHTDCSSEKALSPFGKGSVNIGSNYGCEGF